ncbi:MAG: AbiH family protein, partial [Candidatus Coproplasma sp.]
KILGDLIIENAKYLNFNYTEFIENLYGAKGVCYIHGSRKQKQNKLVLGHSHETEIPSPDLSIIKNRNDRMIGKYALTNAEEHLVWYEEANTKRSPDIIKKYQNFFNSLQDIKTIVIIGHSLSSVDMDYYKEVVSKNRDSENLKWIISCHDIDGLDAVKEFNAFWRIPPEREIIFKL